ncbi:MAG: M14 family metallocarboxypeptidase [Phycisphaerales bacterium]
MLKTGTMHVRAVFAIGVLALGASGVTAQPLAREGEGVRYDGHALVRVERPDARDLASLDAAGILMMSCEASASGVDVLVPPGRMVVLDGLGLVYKVVLDDVQPALDAESARVRDSLERFARGEAGWYEDYKPAPEIDARIDELIARRPDLVSRSVIGTSHEGRPIWAIHVSSSSQACKPVFVVVGTTHAREWITTMSVMYLTELLIDGHGSDADLTALVDSLDFLIVPVLNPDGYAFTWEANRMWRKNRGPHPDWYQGTARRGTDLNRNYSVDWGLNGSSNDPQSDTFRGAEPFSAFETAALRDAVLAEPRVRGFVDVHSYANLVLYPWGTRPGSAPNAAEYQALGEEMADAILDVHGEVFDVGPIRTHLYPISGGSTDWFHVEAGALGFLIEQRGPGFDPPATSILPGAQETAAGLLVEARHVAEGPAYLTDLDRDCAHTYLDVFAFLLAFAAGDPVADLDHNSVFTFDDALAFLTLFSEGR